MAKMFLSACKAVDRGVAMDNVVFSVKDGYEFCHLLEFGHYASQPVSTSGPP